MSHSNQSPTTGRRDALLLFAAAATLAACGGADSSKSSSSSGGGSASLLTLEEVSNGFGQIVPYRTMELDGTGSPTGQVIPLRTNEDIADHVRRGNPVLPPPRFDSAPVLPSGEPGNHFFVARFSQDLDVGTIVDATPGAQATSGLTAAVSVTSIDPLTGTALPLRGRVFVGGRTLVGPPTGNPPSLQFEQWVRLDEDTGQLVALVPEAVGFPGVGSPVPGAADLVSPRSVVFVADDDDDLTDFDTFPTGVSLRFRVTTALRAQNGSSLQQQVLASTVVGEDLLGPEVITTPPPLNAPLITPGNGDVNVDPRTTVRIEFTEPVQPYSVGDVEDGGPPSTNSGVKIGFGPSTSRTDMPFSVLPVSPFDLTTYELFPAFFFPGAGPDINNCGTFSTVDVSVNPGQIEDLAQNEDPNNPGQFIPNTNLLNASTFFVTGEGPGIVNAPVAPDAIYLGRIGAQPGLSVLDLNGFGASTGNPVHTSNIPREGESKYPFNPNVAINLAIRPPLQAGTCTIDGGSAGVFTLTLDSALSDKVVRAPIVSSIQDMQFGHALDLAFNNAPQPFGCQAGGGDICTLDGFKVVNPVVGAGPNTLGPAAVNQFGALQAGYENLINWAPHPNPPPLIFPPLCVAPFLNGEEPSSIDNTVNVPIVQNLLVPGDPFGRPLSDPPEPPSGILTPEQNAFFLGPSFAQTQVANCLTYQVRQQVGHYLYIVDRPRSEVVVLNSNRMTVVDRIAVADPTSMAMGPNLDFIGITNQLADTATFVDINPASSQFHTVVKTVNVGDSPRGIAWEPTNEDILVCNEFDNTMSIISAQDLDVRRVVGSQLNRPFEVCVTPRMVPQMTFQRNVYFAYVLNRNGSVAVFESGPNGVNGWGFDDIIGTVPFSFQNPKTVQLDLLNLDASVYIVHEGPIDAQTGNPGNVGEGAVSRLHIESALAGQLPLQVTGVINPNFRDMEFGVPLSLGEDQLSGIPVDIAFDDQRSIAGLIAPATTFSAGSALPANGKQNYRQVPTPVNCSEPQFLFAAVPNPVGGVGVVDVFRLGASGTPRIDVNPYVDDIQSVEAPGVTVLSHFWRQ